MTRSFVRRYFLGIIDILQEYNMRKKCEKAYKVRVMTLKGHDPTTVSVQTPRIYADRFYSFMCDQMD